MMTEFMFWGELSFGRCRLNFSLHGDDDSKVFRFKKVNIGTFLIKSKDIEVNQTAHIRLNYTRVTDCYRLSFGNLLPHRIFLGHTLKCSTLDVIRNVCAPFYADCYLIVSLFDTIYSSNHFGC